MLIKYNYYTTIIYINKRLKIEYIILKPFNKKKIKMYEYKMYNCVMPPASPPKKNLANDNLYGLHTRMYLGKFMGSESPKFFFVISL